MDAAPIGDHQGLRELLAGLPRAVAARGEAQVLAELQAALDALERLRAGLDPAAAQREMDAFRRACHGLILQSTFSYAVFTRPHGYPGDYETQELIWLGRTEGGPHRYRGNSRLGELLTSISLDMAAPRANEARIRRLTALVRGGGLESVASIGAGSAIEFWGEGPVPRRVLLLDQDLAALERARARGRFDGAEVTCLHENVVRAILRNGKQRLLGERDLVYSFGLLDYFPAPLARRIAEALWVSVRPGGRLLLTNAHPGHSTRLWMEWGGDWWLDHKTEPEMRALAEGLPDVASVAWDLDPFGVYQYLEVRRAG